MAACPHADVFAALVAGTISSAQRAEVANHAAGCEACHALVERIVDVGSGGRDPTVPFDDMPALELGPGAHLGRYVIDNRLGAGGMGVVYAAVDSELERRVAVKLLRAETSSEIVGTAGRERLMREARTLARLSHPNVVTVFDVGTHRGHQFVAMELVDGGSLAAWLDRAPRTPDVIVDRMLEAGRGLAAAHSAGVVHRDVKPDNILVGLDGRARVTDFGLARQGATVQSGVMRSGSSELTQTGALLGTPAYMAPEQITRADVLTDQWSYCATFYEALAGVRPFPTDDTRTTAIVGGKLATPRRPVPSWIKPLLARGLLADPTARWLSMDALIATIVRRRYRRRNQVIGAAAVGIVAAAIAIAVPFVRSEPAPAKRDGTFKRDVTWVDQREGCSCPYSACDNRCVAVCNAPAYKIGEKVPGINTVGRQDVIVGTSGDGNTLLYLTGTKCRADHLMIAHKRGNTYIPVDLTPQIDAKRFVLTEYCCTLAADGKSIVLATANLAGFVEVQIDAQDRLGSETPLAVLPRPADEVGPYNVVYPRLTADRNALYYRLWQMVDDDYGPLDGIYVVDLAGAAAGRPRRIPGARPYSYVTGVSSDNLSLFVTLSFGTNVLVRKTTADPFAGFTANMPPAPMAGFRNIPTADCQLLFTTVSPGGCEQEDIAYLVPDVR